MVLLYKELYRKECCNERKANCLACEQGISVKEFCRRILQNPIMMYSNRYPECKGSFKLSILHFRKSLSPIISGRTNTQLDILFQVLNARRILFLLLGIHVTNANVKMAK